MSLDEYLNVMLGTESLLEDQSLLRNMATQLELALHLFQSQNNQHRMMLCLKDLGSIYGRLQDYDKALKYGFEALKLTRKIKNKQEEGKTLSDIGLCLLKLSRYSEALEYSQQALKIVSEVGDIQSKGIVLGNIGVIYKFLGEHEKAIEYSLQALKIDKSLGDKYGEAEDCQNLGIVYHKIGKEQKSLEYLQLAILAYEEGNSLLGQMKNHGIIGEVYASTGNYTEAIESFKKAIGFSQKIGDRKWEGFSLANIGTTYYITSDYDEALEYLQRALKVCEEIGEKQLEASVVKSIEKVHREIQAASEERPQIQTQADELAHQGSVHFNKGDSDVALDKWNQALQLYREIGDIKGEATCLGNIGAFNEDLEGLFQALEISRKIGFRRGEADQLANIGTVYIDREPAKAIDYLKQAIQISDEINNPNLKAKISTNMGNAFQKLGKPNEALKSYIDSLKIFYEVDDPQDYGLAVCAKLTLFIQASRQTLDPQTMTQAMEQINEIKNTSNLNRKIDLLYVLILLAELLKDNERLLRIYEEIIETAQKTEDKSREALGYEMMALLQKRLGNLSEVEKYRNLALEIHSETNNKQAQANQIIGIGNAHQEKGNLEEALTYYEEALTICNQIGYLHGKIVVLSSIGRAYQKMGKLEEAINILEEALQINRQTEGRRDAKLLQFLAHCYDDLNQLSKAMEYHIESYKIAREQGDIEEQISQLTNLAGFYWRIGNFQEALSVYEDALEASCKTGNRQEQANLLANMGRIYVHLGKPFAIEFLEQALAINRKIGNQLEEALALSSIGDYYLSTGKLKESVDYLTQALELFQMLSNHEVTFHILSNLGMAHERMRNYEFAWQNYKSAIEEIESVRSQLIQEEHKISFVGKEKIEVYTQTIFFLYNHTKDKAEIVKYIEGAKSRAFIEQLGHTVSPASRNIPFNLLQEERRLITIIQDRNITLKENKNDEQRHQLSVEMTTAQEQLDHVLDEIEKMNLEYASLRRGRPLNFEEIKKCLR
jgi:tetratricopeptide (TPR) repeat protein